jgi:hypothetical protein
MEIRRKTSEQLSTQFQKAEKILGSSFFISKEEQEKIIEKDLLWLKENYPYKHKVYIEIIKKIKQKIAENNEIIREDIENDPDANKEDIAILTDLTKKQEEAITESIISERDYIRTINSLESYITSYETDQPEGKLREYQQDTFHSLKKFFNSGKKEGFIEMPTGTGKLLSLWN